MQGYAGVSGDADIDQLAAAADADATDRTYPTVLQEAMENMERLPNCVLLTRVGSFYELYFHQADEYAPLLNLRLAKKKTIHGPISMAGFPFMHLDRYLKVLVQELHKYVAISEEFPNVHAKPEVLKRAAKSRSRLADFDDGYSKSDKKSANMFVRKVCRIITPGTLIDEKFLNPTENNYLLSVHLRPYPELELESDGQINVDAERFHIALAWLDFSTGDFSTQTSSHATLASDIARISPSEILLDKKYKSGSTQDIYRSIEDQQYFISYGNFETATATVALHDLTDDELQNMRTNFVKSRQALFEEENVRKSDVEKLNQDELSACAVLLDYVTEKLPQSTIKVQLPVRRIPVDNMLIDVNTMRALEIKKTLREQLTSGSLLSTIKRTVTKSGTRLLSDWLSSPVTSIPTIVQRQNLVETFLNDNNLHQMVILYLKRTHDSHRIVQKLALNRGTAEDMIALLQSIQNTSKIRQVFEDYISDNSGERSPQTISTLQIILDRLVDLTNLEELILKTFDQEMVIRHLSKEEQRQADALAAMERSIGLKDIELRPQSPKSKQQTRKGAPIDTIEIMKRNASRSLSKLHRTLEKSIKERDFMEQDLKEQLEANSIDLRWAPGMGFYVHASGKDIVKFENTETEYGNTEARCLVARKNTRWYHLSKWAEIGNGIDTCRMLIRLEEKKIFNDIREKVVAHMSPIRKNARVLDELDVACSFSTLARERQLVRPIMHNGISHHIVAGRHPTVEHGLAKRGLSFVPNDCFLNENERLWLITGPNMGGKSTFLRQNALINILAQVGCFVPADFAELGIVDQIFSRVGSADNLYRDESTFMVEMLETANILKQATSSSFVVMDEIGRGTTPIEGFAIAYGVLHHLYHINKSRTLFATHFHDLADMLIGLDHAACYCTDIAQDPETGGIYFAHKLRRGVNHRSHGLHVARLAGVPQAALEVAEKALSALEESVGRVVDGASIGAARSFSTPSALHEKVESGHTSDAAVYAHVQ
ncbi:muts domain V-domain-containing protein [Limtongia smithiae]|uniref:muts domain V-domain-containing protein n=1 Tax=Limtongia smithiae TaxID=1125753 RepID=UPI0034CEF8BF